MARHAARDADAMRAGWPALAAGLLVLVAMLAWHGTLQRLDRPLQDAWQSVLTRPVHPDVVLVAIDDRSVAQVGRWPWRRALHAALIDRLHADGARAIGLDLILSESDPTHPQDDLALATAMARSGRVVLPLALQVHGEQMTPVLPATPFASAAAALGHVHLVPDEDGIARSLYLWEGPPGASLWPHLSLAMLVAAGRVAPGAEAPDVEDPLEWQRRGLARVPYAGAAGSVTTVSYVDVLHGKVPSGSFAGKFVLIGATAAGLGDRHPTPMSAHAGPMSGVELSAQMLDALLTGTDLRVAGHWMQIAFSLAPLLLALAGLALLSPLGALLLNAALVVLVLAGGGVAMAWGGVVLAPSPALVGLLAVYPLWSWRRLAAASRYLAAEVEHLREQGLVAATGEPHRGDFLERRMRALRQATRQLRELHRFVADSLGSLPDAIFVTDARGRIVFANTAAVRRFTARGGQPLDGTLLTDVLARLTDATGKAPALPADAPEDAKVPSSLGFEARDPQARDLLVKCTPRIDADGRHAGWIVGMVDVSDIRQAEHQRNEALRFLTHDLRDPQSAILTLLELHATDPQVIAPQELLERIERHARRTLELADGYVHLARARSHAYRLQDIDLHALLHEAVDDAWAPAVERRITLHVHPVPPEVICRADRELMLRAIGNLLSNAIKFSPPGGRVECRLLERDRRWIIEVTDQGPGVAPHLKARLFEPFERLHTTSLPDVKGAGLGLSFVRTVAHRHGGEVELDSEPGRGATFRIVLPGPAIPGS